MCVMIYSNSKLALQALFYHIKYSLMDLSTNIT
jgi:hypothetical protein